jgi:hypothetical protein
MKYLNLTFFGFSLLLMSLMQSCVSTSALQTARVTPKGEIATGIGVLLPKAELIAGDSTDFNGFAGEISLRYGITDKLDVGTKITLIGTGGVDAKYQFIGDGDSKFAGSAGLGLGYLTLDLGGARSTIVDLTIPAYFSYHPINAVALYVSPRFLYRNVPGFSNTFFGGIGGVRLGTRKFGIFGEYVYLESSNKETNSNQTQWNIGLGFNIQ